MIDRAKNQCNQWQQQLASNRQCLDYYYSFDIHSVSSRPVQKQVHGELGSFTLKFPYLIDVVVDISESKPVIADSLLMRAS